MRTLRLVGMTLLMVMLAVNFAACSNDDTFYCWHMEVSF